MADITIHEVDLTFDLEKVTITEHRAFANGSLMDAADDEHLAKVTGQPVEFFRALSQPNYRRVLRAYFKKASAPLDDPN
jgi:hypothetical protein